MEHEQAKKIAVQAINRIVSAAKELAEAEAMLLVDKGEGKLSTAKSTRHRTKEAKNGRTG